MKRIPKLPKVHPLVKLLREAKRRIGSETLSASLQQSLIPLVMSLLASCTREHTNAGGHICDIAGQWHVKRVLEVAAAGGHNILLISPADVGEAELARTLPSLLPILSLSYPIVEPDCSIEKRALEQALLTELRAAHGGVLFLKDLDTFDLSMLTSLSRTVQMQVSLFPTSETSVVVPAAFLLVATLKPCPCGKRLDPVGACFCSPEEIAQYKQRLKDVVHTCFDIEIEVSPDASVRGEEVLKIYPEDSSAVIRQRVEATHLIQQKRYAGCTHLRRNADLKDPDEIERYCQMLSPAQDLLKSALQQLHLTSLQMMHLQVVARTIADLADEALIAGKHMAEAILYLSRFIRDAEHPSFS